MEFDQLVIFLCLLLIHKIPDKRIKYYPTTIVQGIPFNSTGLAIFAKYSITIQKYCNNGRHIYTKGAAIIGVIKLKTAEIIPKTIRGGTVQSTNRFVTIETGE